MESTSGSSSSEAGPEPLFLAYTLAITFGWQFIFFLPAATCKFDKVTDLAFGTNFVGLAIITLLIRNLYTTRQIVVTCFVAVWGLRLAAYLFYRIIVIGKDKRFDGRRENLGEFLKFWILQFVMVWLMHTPVTLLNSSNEQTSLWALDYVGWAVFLLGFLIEAIADQQKFSYRRNPKNSGHWCDTGLWAWSRHPNYFGEILVWSGLFLSSAPLLRTWAWFSVLSPLSITLVLLAASGLPLLERQADRAYNGRADWARYLKRTSPLILLPPGLYSRMGPLRLLFCECPCYRAPKEEGDEGEYQEVSSDYEGEEDRAGENEEQASKTQKQNKRRS